MEPTKAKVLLKNIHNGPIADRDITRVVTDSREAAPGRVFVAIKGEHVDGHDFGRTACDAGAEYVVAQRDIPDVPREKLVLVLDVLDAMIKMGANYRACYSPLVVGVTGSVGKTTTKEFCASVLSGFGETLKTEGNQNNEIGMPNTLFRMTDATRYAVIEMGMQGFGEIRKLVMAAKPDAAIITKIGEAHIEMLGSIQGVLQAKLEIAEGLPFNGPLVLNGDDAMLRGAALPSGVRPVFAGIADEHSDVRAVNVVKRGEGQAFTIRDVQFGEYDAYIPALGLHNVQNALLSYTAVTRLGLNADAAAAALTRYEPAGKRQRIVQRSGVTVIEDYYNANPDSMRAALDILADMEVKGRKIAVLGDMLELGAVTRRAHSDLGREAAKAGVQHLLTVGPNAAATAKAAKECGVQAEQMETNAEAAARLKTIAKEGDVVLIKASNAMKFGEIAAALERSGV